MASSYVTSRPRGRRYSVEDPPYRVYEVDDTASHRSSRYDGNRYDNECIDNSEALVLIEPSRRTKEEEPRSRRYITSQNQALISRPARARSKSRPRFRDDESVIDEIPPSAPPEDGRTYVRSRARPGQRNNYALVRSKSRRRRASSGDERDLERKNTRRNREFRGRRDDLEVEEATVLVRAKSREREQRNSRMVDEYRRNSAAIDYSPSQDSSFYRARDREILRERNRRPRIEIPSDDERDIVIVPRNGRRRDSFDETRSQYSERSAYSRNSERSSQSTLPPATTRPRASNRGRDDYVVLDEGYSRSREGPYRERRGLVEGMRYLMS